MAGNIIVVGTSAGGLAALQALIGGMRDLAGTMFIVQHTAPNNPGMLPSILQRASAWPVAHAVDRDVIQLGKIYVAPPDRHLVVNAEQVLVTNGPKENMFRPAIDPLFRSAALAFGPRVIGVILSGSLDDGSAGLWAVKQRGGIAVVQRPEDAAFPGMPVNALRYVAVDHCLAAAELGPLLDRLGREAQPSTGEFPMPEELELETRIAAEEKVSKREILRVADPTIFTCPECHGVLLQLKKSGILSFRCHTGHAYSVQSLLAQVSTDVESNLWNAIRSVEESVLLLDHVGKHLNQARANTALGATLLKNAREAEKRAAMLRQVVLEHERINLEDFESGSQADPVESIPEKTSR
jgi:two-component system chemotaxis response regulator CheB